ncbi:MAG: aminotransferase class IV [Anaerolineales bacterium]|nr:aminotransferase class IV [Anaerolineales bacterium]
MTESICYVNGQYLPVKEAFISVQDLAVLRGYGVFDFLRTYHGRPFKLREHLLRLERSAQHIELKLPQSLDAIEQVVCETLQRNTLPEANIRVVVTGGVSADGITPPAETGLIVLVTPVKHYPAEFYDHGVKVITVETERYIPGAKTINYIPAILAMNKAKAAGAVEALYVNRHGHILEGTTTNFYLVQGNQIITPVDEILPGVTRSVLLEVAQSLFDVVERPITFADLADAEEAFISASNKEIMPVHHVDDQQIGSGTRGPKTKLIMEHFREVTWGSQA